MSNSVSRLLTSVVHAGVAVTIFVLLRETGTLPWTPFLDSAVGLTAAAAILALWWLLPQVSRRIKGGVGFGLAAAAATGLVLFIAMAIFQKWWLVGQPVGLPAAGLVIGAVLVVFWVAWFFSVGTMAIGCLAGGVVANLAVLLPTRFGTAGIAGAVLLASMGLLVPAGAIYGRTMAGMGFIDLVTRHDVLRSFPAKVSVSLAVQGAPVVLERTVLCQRPLTFVEQAEARKGQLPKPYWLPSIKSFGHLFADGSAIFVITPDACRDLAMAREADAAASLENNVLPPDFRPLVGWTRDGSGLDSFELYVDGTAYARPDAEIQILSVAMSRLPYGSPIDPLDGFAEFGWEYFQSTDVTYGSYFATAIPPALWRQHGLAARQLADVTELGFVFGGRRWRQSLPRGSLPDGLLIMEIARNGTAIPDASNDNGREYQIVPLRRAGDAWVLTPADTGLVAFYRGLKTTFWPRRLPDRITIGGRLARPGESGADTQYLYDPRSRVLYMISTGQFRVARPGTIFTSWQP